MPRKIAPDDEWFQIKVMVLQVVKHWKTWRSFPAKPTANWAPGRSTASRLAGSRSTGRKSAADAMPGTREIWINAQSSLPVLVRDDTKWPDNSDHSLTIKDIQYNIDLDPKLFDTTPPDGYKDTTGKPLPLEEQKQLEVCQITRAMKTYAEVFGGCYPATHGDLLKAVFGGVKAKLISGNSERAAKMNTAKAPEALQQEVRTGFNDVLSILAHNSESGLQRQDGRAEGQGQGAPALEARRRPVRGHLRRAACRNRHGGSTAYVGRKIDDRAASGSRVGDEDSLTVTIGLPRCSPDGLYRL